jgi:hypothetical protein
MERRQHWYRENRHMCLYFKCDKDQIVSPRRTGHSPRAKYLPVYNALTALSEVTPYIG